VAFAPVVLASRVEAGRTLESDLWLPGGEIDLLSRGLLAAGGLGALKARILLSTLLSSGAPEKRSNARSDAVCSATTDPVRSMCTGSPAVDCHCRRRRSCQAVAADEPDRRGPGRPGTRPGRSPRGCRPGARRRGRRRQCVPRRRARGDRRGDGLGPTTSDGGRGHIGRVHHGHVAACRPQHGRPACPLRGSAHVARRHAPLPGGRTAARTAPATPRHHDAQPGRHRRPARARGDATARSPPPRPACRSHPARDRRHRRHLGGIAGMALGAWPAKHLWVCAVRERDGRLVVFGRDARPALPDAVAASCAIPGFFAPVEIGGRPSSTEVRTRRRTPMSSWVQTSASCWSAPRCRSGATGACGTRRARSTMGTAGLGSEARRLRRSGAHVLAFQPTPEDLAVIGLNPMDPTRRGAVARQARESTLRRLAHADTRARLRPLME